MKDDQDFTPAEIAHRRDATIKAMIATPPKKQSAEPKRDGKTRGRPATKDRA
jgi:hypothetical protein